MNETITLSELKSKMDTGESFMLVETLPVEYFRHTHLPGAINLPPDKVAELAPTLLPDKNAEVIVYCAKFTWELSEIAARELAALGYKNVRDYKGGKEEWLTAGLPVERHQRRV